MKYYKDNRNNVYAFSADSSQDAYIKNGLVLIAEDEMRELTKPPQDQIIIANESIVTSLKLEAINNIKILEFENNNANLLASWNLYYTDLKAVDTAVEKMELPDKPI